MNIKKILIFLAIFFSISFLFTRPSRAIDLRESLTSENSIIVKVQEGIEYLFAFRVENKVQVLEKHAEKRLVMAQGYADEGKQEKVQNLLQDYAQIKEKQDGLLGKIDDDGEVLDMIQERVVEQQKTMEEIKTKVDGDQKRLVVQVQEQVVNQVAKRVIDTNGTEGLTEFFQKVEHVWAPGTGPGGKGGVVIEGGTMQFAPGTSGGGPSGSDIQTTVVVTGGGQGDGGTTVEGGGQNPAQSKTQDGGGVNPSTSSDGSQTWIDP